jgi:hypothetical protein
MSESVDTEIRRVHSHAAEFARLSLSERLALLEAVRQGYYRVAESLVRAACDSKNIDPNSALAGEEWIADPLLVLRNLRLLISSLQDIKRQGTPHFKSSWVKTLPNGRMAMRVFPYETLDAALLARHEAWIHFLPEVKSEADIRARQASFYQRPHGGKLVAVLGAGNVNSIGPTDCLYKMFVEGKVCVVKMNPVNAYTEPFLKQAFAPLISRGFFGMVSGGPEVGAALVNHSLVEEVHMTGSDKTHDFMVWGPPGPEREAKLASGEPVLRKEITSELGNISPIIIAPGHYTESELEYQARNLVGMATHNASFDCTSAKLLVLSKDWAQREAFLTKVAAHFAKTPPRKAYYPGAEQRWKQFTEGRQGVKVLGQARPGELPWALLNGVEPTQTGDRVFSQEPWCAVLSETSLPGKDLPTFLDGAVRFVNDQVWGTLCMSLIVPGSVQSTGDEQAAVDSAVSTLRYGTVSLNTWSSVAFAVMVTPWGAHPTSTLKDIQSGRGWVHNTLMLEGIEKVVLSSPLKVMPVPPWFPNHRSLGALGKKLVDLEFAPSWLKVPSLAATALRD